MVQQNAALVEESAAAAESIAGQSEDLFEPVSRLKVKSASTAQPAPPRGEHAHRQTPAAARETAMPRLDRQSAPRALPAGSAANQGTPSSRKPEAGDGEWKEF